MKYLLWRDGKQGRTTSAEHIRELLAAGEISSSTLARTLKAAVYWNPLGTYPGVIRVAKAGRASVEQTADVVSSSGLAVVRTQLREIWAALCRIGVMLWVFSSQFAWRSAAA